MVDRSRKANRKPKQSGWRTSIKRGEVIPVVVRHKSGETVIRFGIHPDGQHFIDAPSHVHIIAPNRRPKK